MQENPCDNALQSHLNPAEYVVMVFGGVRATARILGYASPSTICLWKARGGFIPSQARRRILDIAKSQMLDINSEYLDYGRTV